MALLVGEKAVLCQAIQESTPMLSIFCRGFNNTLEVSVFVFIAECITKPTRAGLRYFLGLSRTMLHAFPC